MPRTAKFFERSSGRGSHFSAGDVMALLNPRGREALHARLAALDKNIAVSCEGPLDLTFENYVLGRISRQIHYGTFLGWCEELDVSSPIFHPALWTWRSMSRAADRLNGRAFTAMLVSLDHPVVKIVDANTGAAPRVPEVSWRDSIRHNGFYQRFLQPVWKTLRGAKDDVAFDSGLGEHFREPAAMRFLTRWAQEIGDSEWFEAAAIESYLEKFKAGEERYLEPLLACASAARRDPRHRELQLGPGTRPRAVVPHGCVQRPDGAARLGDRRARDVLLARVLPRAAGPGPIRHVPVRLLRGDAGLGPR
jgi:hypothetical protein